MHCLWPQCLKLWKGGPVSFWRIIGPCERAFTLVVANHSLALMSQSWNPGVTPSHSGGGGPVPPPRSPRSSSLSPPRSRPRRPDLRWFRVARYSRNSSLSKPSSSGFTQTMSIVGSCCSTIFFFETSMRRWNMTRLHGQLPTTLDPRGPVELTAPLPLQTAKASTHFCRHTHKALEPNPTVCVEVPKLMKPS